MDTKFKSGLYAAHVWMFDNQFLELPDVRPAHTHTDTYGIRTTSKSMTELIVKIETEATLAANVARDRMHDNVRWREEGSGDRMIALFVPAGTGQTARELLGLYDEIIEFSEVD